MRRKEHLRFAREIGQRLDAGLVAGEFNALWFFASSPFLGELKARLSDAVDKACNARSIATSLPSASPRSSSGCSIHGCEGREALFRAGTCALDKPQGENRVGFLDWT